MEIFCKVISEDMITAERKIAAVAFLTFVALDENKKPIKAIARNNSKEFFLKQGFKDVETKNPEGHDILIWNP